MKSNDDSEILNAIYNELREINLNQQKAELKYEKWHDEQELRRLREERSKKIDEHFDNIAFWLSEIIVFIFCIIVVFIPTKNESLTISALALSFTIGTSLRK